MGLDTKSPALAGFFLKSAGQVLRYAENQTHPQCNQARSLATSVSSFSIAQPHTPKERDPSILIGLLIPIVGLRLGLLLYYPVLDNLKWFVLWISFQTNRRTVLFN